MQIDEFWKNFKLGSELDIAGRFIYNGLKSFDQTETFYFEEDAFEFLYNISVGIERLLKIVIILSEHDQTKNQIKFEKSLITHNHMELVSRAKKNNQMSFGKVHNRFLQLLDTFYRTHRYDRFSLESFTIEDKEKQGLISFFEDELGISIDTESAFEMTRNDIRIKRFIGKVVGRVCEQCFEAIKSHAQRLN